MNILSIDTSTKCASVALINDNTIIGEYKIANQKTHSEKLMVILDHLLNTVGLKLADVDVFAVSVGPGSFTGLRIGMATAKTFAAILKKPIIGVSSLEAMAYNLGFSGELVCPIIDARRGDLYNALFQGGKRLIPDRFINIDDLLLELDGKRVVFVGDGAINYKDKIIEKMGDSAVFIPEHFSYPDGINTAMIAFERAKQGLFDNAYTLNPSYIRLSQAERELLEKENNK